jgi:hypothetical protein
LGDAAPSAEVSPKAENTSDSANEKTTGQIAPRPSFGQAIKRLFRAVAKAIITDHPPPKPKRRRKRDEDTRGLFKKLAMKILGPIARAISEPDPWYMPPGELDDAQRLLMRERHRQDAFWQHQHNQAFHYDQRNHLSPRF